MPTPERTSHAEIVSAGRHHLEEEGLSGLTMQAVALRVGVRAPSLYKRIRNRDALLIAVAESAVDELTSELEAAGADVSALVRAYRTFARERPEAFRLIFSSIVPQKALERAAVPVVQATTQLVGEQESLNAARLIISWATGFIHMELAGAFCLGGEVDQAFAYGLHHLVTGLRHDAGQAPRTGVDAG